MRIIAGEARGTALKTLPGTDVTRPTVARVKRGHVQRCAVPLPGARAGRLRGSASWGWRGLAAGRIVRFSGRTARGVRRGAGKRRRRTPSRKGPVSANKRWGLPCRLFRHLHLVLLDPPYHHGTMWRPFCPPWRRCWRRAAWCWRKPSGAAARGMGALRLARQYRYGTVLVSKYTLWPGGQ